MPPIEIIIRVFIATSVAFYSTLHLRAADPIDFKKQIAPIFRDHCIRCHSPGDAKGNISLTTGKDLNEYEFIIPGKPDESYLVELITPVDGKPSEMPQEGDPLTDDQTKLIRRWIKEGAKWPKDYVIRSKSRADASWWSLQPLRNDEPPAPAGLPGDWEDNPIDRFIFAAQVDKGLRPNPPADQRTLIRRATYDLTGLPPTPGEIDSFANDKAPDAYSKLIDRLLASPHYGEHWGRHWLDVVRFGESNGYERNFIINDLWPFRDYVIRSLNDDKPFDQFIREHLAGDVIGKDDPKVEIGSAFLVAGPYDDVGNQDPAQAAQIRADQIDEIIRATTGAFMGLTVGCARCHDHKFDPILQKDYYSFYATFAGVRHGSRVVATRDQRAAHSDSLRPLRRKRNRLSREKNKLVRAISKRAKGRLEEYEKAWVRPPIDRLGTEETFDPVEVRFVRLISLGRDSDPANTGGFGIDEFEVWSTGPDSRNVALASNGGNASGPSRQIEDFPGAYGPHLAIDGETGARFLAAGSSLTIELAQPTIIDRILFSSAKGESNPEHSTFTFLAEYRIEGSLDGQQWREIANSYDRRPVNAAHREHRLRKSEMTDEEKLQLAELDRSLAEVNRKIAAIPALPTAWVGSRSAKDAEGPFHIFLGGNPMRKGGEVAIASLAALSGTTPPYALPSESKEAQRRTASADWIVHPKNPLTARVLANRLWHYHFGTGIVDTPSDFGYMGGRPTHPALLDWLAREVHKHGWRLKPLHKLIMMSQTYRQSSEFREEAAMIDGAARLLWRFPPRRLSAEQIRDTMLKITGKLDITMGGPGFRLYRFMQDNVATYAPLDKHGPETYRRAVYHQNARASVIDLMTDFDQPDCAFSTPRRAETTTPLQALTMLNHQFTLDMADFLANRVQAESGTNSDEQIQRAIQLCYGRPAGDEELSACRVLVKRHGLPALCRVLLNTSEMIYVR